MLCRVAWVVQAYGIAHRMEMDDCSIRQTVFAPSPYARLNQLTLEILASNGLPEDRDRLLTMVKQAEEVRLVQHRQQCTAQYDSMRRTPYRSPSC